jgi:hypothetical protein
VHELINLAQTHWSVLVAVALALWGAFNTAMSAISNSLPAPTAQSTPRYIFWFRVVNYGGFNWNRAKNISRIEDSPNFIPAAEAYMQKKIQGSKDNPS